MEEFHVQTPLLNLTRKKLYLKLRALAAPMGHLTDTVIKYDKEHSIFPCGTDGFLLYWNRSYLKTITIDREDTAFLEACLLHQLIHCLFGHPFHMPFSVPSDMWSLFCDISAWHIASIWLPDLVPAGLKETLQNLQNQISGALYRPEIILDQLGTSPWFDQNREKLFHDFSFDDHSRWPVFQISSRTLSGKIISAENGRGNRGNTSVKWDSLRRSLTEKKGPLSPEEPKNKKRIPPSMGSSAKNQRRTVTLTETRRHNYRDLLRGLSSWGEEVCLNTDEFQYASYLYGLEHYDGLPLIEPLEYQESKKIRELAIVIDTSASCSHSLTQAFLEETRNLIKEESLFFHPFNLHIIQCDVKVQKDDKLTSLDDLERYIETLEIHGMGGTNFCPAFAHIESLQKNGEFTSLSGILFFTDGSGIYPSKKPDVPTTFIFLNHHYDAIDVPPWANTLILDAEKPKGIDYEY